MPTADCSESGFTTEEGKEQVLCWGASFDPTNQASDSLEIYKETRFLEKVAIILKHITRETKKNST